MTRVPTKAAPAEAGAAHFRRSLEYVSRARNALEAGAGGRVADRESMLRYLNAAIVAMRSSLQAAERPTLADLEVVRGQVGGLGEPERLNMGAASTATLYDVVLERGRVESAKRRSAALAELVRRHPCQDCGVPAGTWCRPEYGCRVESRCAALECEGHPAGPADPMGETVYCDGGCRR